MRVTVEFSEDEQEEAVAAVRGEAGLLRAALAEADERLRSLVKYDDTISDDARVAYQRARAFISEALGARGIDIYD